MLAEPSQHYHCSISYLGLTVAQQAKIDHHPFPYCVMGLPNIQSSPVNHLTPVASAPLDALFPRLHHLLILTSGVRVQGRAVRSRSEKAENVPLERAAQPPQFQQLYQERDSGRGEAENVPWCTIVP